MSDPRVSSLLNRLGGLYRDPSRIDRDASAALRSNVGQHLQPTVQQLVENDGTSSSTLCLQGTIAMHFKGNTYQLMVDIYLPPGYPVRTPVCFVRLGAPNMYYKERHKHVGADGCVYLPYLHEWKPHTHNLIELIVAMSSVFSADPPVFTRSGGTSASTSTSSAASTTASSSNLDRDSLAQVQQVVAREVEEANRAAETAREAERLEREKEQQLQEQIRLETAQWEQLHDQVTQKLQSQLRQLQQRTKQVLIKDLQDQRRLEQDGGYAQQMEFLSSQETNLKGHHETLDSALAEMKEALQRARDAKENSTGDNEPLSVDELCVPASALEQQQLDLTAQNASLTDALYFVDLALQKGSIDLQVHLKHVRQLSKKQFLTRAHLEKIDKRKASF